MCQATIGRIIKVKDKEAIAKINGKPRKIMIDLLDVKEGDYVLCSLNLAIEKVDPDEAKMMIA